ncbi:class II fructose-bisphosphate aldolase [Candidatus Woesearchaeota archaeon]|nr:class II fructose-bisphosphate aldolase [Candidatus Woesearchaeota archaeon]
MSSITPICFRRCRRLKYEALPGAKIFNALHSGNSIIMAVNPRIAIGVLDGIFRAAKETDSALIFELARTEAGTDGGYTGMNPKTFAEAVTNSANKIGFDTWTIHADHLQVKKRTPEQIEDLKGFISEQIAAGYKSFALDCSHLYNAAGKTIYDQLKDNIEVSIELAKFIEKKLGYNEFGLEVEVGEIGKKDKYGNVITSPEEAVTFIKSLHDAGVKPHALAIANGSTHGNIYDKNGNPVPQLTIDIPRTIAVAEALGKNGFDVRIAQHGITGTPLDLIATKFPHGKIIKGNVGTLWMNIVWYVLNVYEPELYNDILRWTLDNYRKEAEKKGMTKDEQIFGIYSKYAIKQFFDRINSVSKETERAIEASAYYSALMFFKAFNSFGSAGVVRKSL